jgi:hypothetical protein
MSLPGSSTPTQANRDLILQTAAKSAHMTPTADRAACSVKSSLGAGSSLAAESQLAGHTFARETASILTRLAEGSKPEDFINAVSALKLHINDVVNVQAHELLRSQWPNYQPPKDRATSSSQKSIQPGQRSFSKPSGAPTMSQPSGDPPAYRGRSR